MRRILPIALLMSLFMCSGALGSSYRPGAEIVSASLERLEQGDDESTNAVISGNGRYVAFQTRARNFFAADDPEPPGHYRIGGIFRRDLVSGALDLVADGSLQSSSLPDSSLPVFRGAQNPSISADGRYIAFSSSQQLVPEDHNPNLDVYVRDMTVSIRSPGAYDLVSARDGGTVPASYASTRFGSDITRSRAISADGQKVVFKTTNASDLPAGSGPSATPTQQVFVRDRAARTTTLVTLTNEPPPGQTELAPAGGADSSAVISADGTTVVWAGQNSFPDCSTGEPGQTAFLTGELLQCERGRRFYLWRRIADGAAATTRRITGAVDLDDPGCAPDAFMIPDPVAAAPCYGPLALAEDWNSDLPSEPPALSADGYRVAFLVNPALRPNNVSGNAPDVFVTDMRPGLSRKASTVELTREIVGDVAGGSFVTGLGMTNDGRQIVFSTVRSAFILPSPRLVDPPAAVPDVPEIYSIDLDAMEIERVTRPDPGFEQLNPLLWNGGEVNGDPATLPGLSISDDGGRIAFSSRASNLFVGDSNDKGDSFVVNRGAPGSQGGQQAVADLPFDLPSQPVDRRRAVARIAVRVKSARRGRVRLAVRVTDAGLVEARALSRVRSSRKGPRSGRTPLRTFARARKNAPRAGEVDLVLRTAARYRTLLPKRGLTARLLVSFTPSGGGPKITARRSVALAPADGRKSQLFGDVLDKRSLSSG